jgi:hypothetical protein
MGQLGEEEELEREMDDEAMDVCYAWRGSSAIMQ